MAVLHAQQGELDETDLFGLDRCRSLSWLQKSVFEWRTKVRLHVREQVGKATGAICQILVDCGSLER